MDKFDIFFLCFNSIHAGRSVGCVYVEHGNPCDLLCTVSKYWKWSSLFECLMFSSCIIIHLQLVSLFSDRFRLPSCRVIIKNVMFRAELVKSMLMQHFRVCFIFSLFFLFIDWKEDMTDVFSLCLTYLLHISGIGSHTYCILVES